VVYDKGTSDALGRYVVAKTMRLPNGQTRTPQSYYVQRPAALRYAKRFLAMRATKAGKSYTEGDGKKTIMGHQPEGGAS
jgi:hypothetical protein